MQRMPIRAIGHAILTILRVLVPQSQHPAQPTRSPVAMPQTMSQPKIKICIADDHAILREGLRALLSANPGLEIVREVEDGLELIRSVQQHAPDIVLLDLSLPKIGGLEAISELKKRLRDIKIIILTVHAAEEYVAAALQAGANGYLLKEDTTGAGLKMAIQTVLSGKMYLSPGISATVVQGFVSGKTTPKQLSAWDGLTLRERELVTLIAQGFTSKDIAKQLSRSVKTIERHRANLMKKLNLHNTAALTTFALEKGLLPSTRPYGAKRGAAAAWSGSDDEISTR